MRHELDPLQLPPDFVLMQETVWGSSPRFMGETPSLHRQYRAPRDIYPTFREIEQATLEFATPTRDYRMQADDERIACVIGFRRRGFLGDIVARSALGAGSSEATAVEDEPVVWVEVRLVD